MVINTLNIAVAFLFSYFRYDEKANFIIVIGSFSLITSMAIVITESKKMKDLQSKAANNKT